MWTWPLFLHAALLKKAVFWWDKEQNVLRTFYGAVTWDFFPVVPFFATAVAIHKYAYNHSKYNLDKDNSKFSSQQKLYHSTWRMLKSLSIKKSYKKICQKFKNLSKVQYIYLSKICPKYLWKFCQKICQKICQNSVQKSVKKSVKILYKNLSKNL